MSDRAGASGNKRRWALVAPSAASVLHNRDSLIRAAIEQGHSVLVVAPDAEGDLAARLAGLGAEPRAVALRPSGLSLFANRNGEIALAEAFAAWRPDVVMGFALRPMVLAALAGKRAGVERIVSLVNGLPEFGLSRPSDDGMNARHLAKAFKASHAIVVHNPDDARRLQENGIVPAGVEITEVPGAGIDLAHHAVQPLPALGQGLVFLMIARLDRAHGAHEYVEAAHIVKARAPGARFLLAGPRAAGRDALAADGLAAGQGAIEHLGEVDDVRPVLARAHVFVYPSRAEGMPRTVLEALAAGRPVITTGTPGCRETVDERVNGCLVPAGDVAALSEAMESFLKRPDLIPAMARASRTKAERRFDVHEVNRVLLGVLGLA